VTLIAVWKIVQVWTLKYRLGVKTKELIIVEAQRDWANCIVIDRINYDAPAASKTEWPDEIN
jgi:hypothetical protein